MDEATRDYVRKTLSPLSGELRTTADIIDKIVADDDPDVDDIERAVLAPKNAGRLLADAERYVRKVQRRQNRAAGRRRERGVTGGQPSVKLPGGKTLTAPHTAPSRLKVSLRGVDAGTSTPTAPGATVLPPPPPLRTPSPTPAMPPPTPAAMPPPPTPSPMPLPMPAPATEPDAT